MKHHTVASIALMALTALACKADQFSQLDHEAFDQGVKYSDAHISKCGNSQFAYYYSAKSDKEARTIIEFTLAAFSPGGGYVLDERRKLVEATSLRKPTSLTGSNCVAYAASSADPTAPIAMGVGRNGKIEILSRTISRRSTGCQYGNSKAAGSLATKKARGLNPFLAIKFQTDNIQLSLRTVRRRLRG